MTQEVEKQGFPEEFQWLFARVEVVEKVRDAIIGLLHLDAEEEASSWEILVGLSCVES